MSTQTYTLNEIYRLGLEALNKKLGTEGMLRFLEIYDSGSGDYTKDRHKILKEESVEEIVAKIYSKRKRKNNKKN